MLKNKMRAKQIIPEYVGDEGVGNSKSIVRLYGLYEMIDDETIANSTLVFPEDFTKKITKAGISLPSKLR